MGDDGDTGSIIYELLTYTSRATGRIYYYSKHYFEEVPHEWIESKEDAESKLSHAEKRFKSRG